MGSHPTSLFELRRAGRVDPRRSETCAAAGGLGGYVRMGRMMEKGRATIAGTAGEYHFDCPVDNMLFGFKGVKGADVRAVLASGASDAEVLAWFGSHGTAKSDAEVKAWADG